MLTATYSFVAIHAEQKIVGLMLARLRQSVQSTWRDQEHIDSTVLASSLARLTEFDGYSATRKLERYVIPAMCGSCAEVDRILDELAAFSAAAKCTLTALHDTLRITLEQGHPDVYDVVTAMESYCDTLAKRFAKEQAHLFPLAERCLSSDAWFSIGTRCLSDDEAQFAQHRMTSPALPQRAIMA